MRPRHYAEDKAAIPRATDERLGASMRPRHYAEDKAPPSRPGFDTAIRFNEASALRRG